MEAASVASSLNTYYALSIRHLSTRNRTHFSSPSLLKNSSNIKSFCVFKGSSVPIKTVKLRQSSLAALAGDTSAAPNDSAKENVSTTEWDGNKNSDENKDGVDRLADHNMTRACDKLIDVFMVDKPSPNEWRKLLAFSRTWDNIRPHFFNRCQERADSETDPGIKHRLLRLGRKLKEVDEDVQRHNELFEMIRKSPSEINTIIARRRKDFTKEFFVHIYTVAESYYDNPTEKNAVGKLGNMCVEAVQAYDSVTESKEAINAAELKLQDIINSPSLAAACKKIDDLAEKNQLDSTLVLMLSKAWSAAKETDMTKYEVKDVLYHLYMTARGNLQRLVPKDIRIVKYLLVIEDPEELMSALNDAFTPGEEIEGKDVDCLFTTPERLHTWIKCVVDAYHLSREGTLIREARDLMNPKIIKKLEELKKLIQDKFM